MELGRVLAFTFGDARQRLDRGEAHGGRAGQALHLRLVAQQHWQQAEGVRDGRQPGVDPDGVDIVRLGRGIRIYRAHEVDGLMDGRPARISRRLVKRLEKGCWRVETLLDSYRRPGCPAIPLVSEAGPVPARDAPARFNS